MLTSKFGAWRERRELGAGGAPGRRPRQGMAKEAYFPGFKATRSRRQARAVCAMRQNLFKWARTWRTHVVGMYAFDERHPPNSKFKTAGLDGLGGRAFDLRLRHSGYESQSCQHLVGKFACV